MASYQSNGESRPLLNSEQNHHHTHNHGSNPHSHHHNVPINSTPQNDASIDHVRDAFARRDILVCFTPFLFDFPFVPSFSHSTLSISLTSIVFTFH